MGLLSNCPSSGFKSSSNSISNSISSSNSSSSSSSNSFSNSNSSSSTSSNSNSNSSSSSIPISSSSSNSKPSPTYSFTNTEIKFERTNKICNKCKVIIQITCFDTKKSLSKECNSSTVKCEYCSSFINFSGLKGHIERFHEDIVLPRGVYSIREPVSLINGIEPRSEFINSNLRSSFANSSNSAFESNSNFESNSALASIDKSNFLEVKCNFSEVDPHEPKYYKYYLIVSILLAKGIDIDKVWEE